MVGKIFNWASKGWQYRLMAIAGRAAQNNNNKSLYRTKHVRSPDWPGNHLLHIADKKREMTRSSNIKARVRAWTRARTPVRTFLIFL